MVLCKTSLNLISTLNKSMFNLPFCKYSGCGNDFILVDMSKINQILDFSSLASRFCDRREGIGADGLILIEPSENADFKVKFYNADGSLAEMCGNGLRAAVHFFLNKIKIGSLVTVETHERILKASLQENIVTVTMGDVLDIDLFKKLKLDGQDLLLASMNTGVPHALLFVDEINAIDIECIGRKVRHHPEFFPNGTNFNAIQMTNEGLLIRTYERGVEGETLACGTGATAAAIASALLHNKIPPIKVKVLSGSYLFIDFQLINKKPHNVTMSGPCSEIFNGVISIENTLNSSS